MQEITFNIDVSTILLVLVPWIVSGGTLFVWNRMHKGKISDREADLNDCNNRCILLLKKDFIYFGIIAGIVIVVLLTLTFANNRDAVNYFSFAGTLSSIILSVVAIFMTINSENESKDAKSQLDRSIIQMEKVVEDIKRLSTEWKLTAEDVQKQLDDVKASMVDVSNKNREISNRINRIVDRNIDFENQDELSWYEIPAGEEIHND